MTIPVGYSTLAFTFTLPGTTHEVVNTYACDNGAATTPNQISLAWRVAMVNTAGRPYAAAMLSNSYSLVQMKTLSNIGGTLLSYTDFTVTAMTGAMQIPPINTALLVAKETGLAGRKYRGRVFAPWGIGEGNVSSVGIIDTSNLSAAQTSWSAALSALQTALYAPVILHSDGSSPTPITAFTVQAKIGTMGRRLRR